MEKTANLNEKQLELEKTVIKEIEKLRSSGLSKEAFDSRLQKIVSKAGWIYFSGCKIQSLWLFDDAKYVEIKSNDPDFYDLSIWPEPFFEIAKIAFQFNKKVQGAFSGGSSKYLVTSVRL